MASSDAIGGVYKQMAKTLKATPLDNGCPHPLYSYKNEYNWARLANDDRPTGVRLR